MAKREQKSFEDNLRSMQIGCIIFGILQLLSVISAIGEMADSADGSSISKLIVASLILADIIFMYKYTAQKDVKGPLLERIFGVLLIFEGIIYCLSIIFLPLGLIVIALALGVFSEATYFENYIRNNTNIQ